MRMIYFLFLFGVIAGADDCEYAQIALLESEIEVLNIELAMLDLVDDPGNVSGLAELLGRKADEEAFQNEANQFIQENCF